MQEGVSTLEREGARKMSPKSLANLTAKGKGRPPGTPNKVSKSIREAVLEAVQPGMCHPEGLKGWLVERALGGIEDRKIFAGVVSRVIPIEITGEGGGAVKVDLGWLAGRKIGGDVIDITPATQTSGEQATARLATDIQSEAPIAGGMPGVNQVRAGE
jgi:hypothetical protein